MTPSPKERRTMKALDIRLQELADGEISAFEGFNLFKNFYFYGIRAEMSEDLKDEWAECWQDNAICIFRPNDGADESCNLINFWEAGKILEKHCQLESEINDAYFIIDFDSFIAIIDKGICIDFANANHLCIDSEHILG